MSFMKYKTTITLYSSYFDKNDRILPKSILSIFQDVASIHAEEIGVGYQDMLEKNLYWVLSRIKYDIIKMPNINQTVIVETWPHIKGRVDFDRDIKISNEQGETLIIGTSKWCVIDTIRRMLQRTDNVNYMGEYCCELNYEDKFNKIITPEIPFEEKLKYVVRFSDLDHNGHMNNTNYSTLVINAVENKDIKHFEINYLKECKENDEMKVIYARENGKEYVMGNVNENIMFIALVE